MNIVFIPIRSGSKGIPNKNIKLFNGKPLVYWGILAALKCRQVNKIIINTDSTEYINIIKDRFPKSKKIICYKRSKELAQDNTSTEAVMLDYINHSYLKDNDNFILFQITNPFIKSTDITKFIKAFKKNKNNDSGLTVCRTEKFLWKNNKSINYDYKNRPRRQDIIHPTYLENGAMYISKIKDIKIHKNRLGSNPFIFEMPWYSQFEIDNLDDWLICEFIAQKFFKF